MNDRNDAATRALDPSCFLSREDTVSPGHAPVSRFYRSFGLLAVLAALALLLGCNGEEPNGGEPNGGEPNGQDPDPEGASCRELGPPLADGDGPKPVLASPAFAERPAEYGLDPDSMDMVTLQIDGRAIHVVRLRVTTFEDRFGRDWTHSLVVVLPAPGDLAVTDAAVFSAAMGTMNVVGPGDLDPLWGSSHPEWFAGTDSADHYLRSYGSVALSYGVPFLASDILADEIELPHDLAAEVENLRQEMDGGCQGMTCIGPISSDEAKMRCLEVAAFVREDLSNFPYLNMAVAQSRLIDAGQQVAAEVYRRLGAEVSLDWSRLWTIGSSKRGHTQRLFAAIDDRSVGVMINAADISNYPAFFEQQMAAWSGAYSFHDGNELERLLETDFGQEFLKMSDQWRWRAEVLKDVTYLLAIGTQDHLYPIGASLLYAASAPPDFRRTMVPNYRHGHGSVEHVAALRAMVDHGLNGTSWPTLEAQWDLDTNVVRAWVSDGDVVSADLWCSTTLGPQHPAVHDRDEECRVVHLPPEDSPDLRQTTWSHVPMTRVGQRFEAAPPESELSYPACFVRALTADQKPLASAPLLSRRLCEAVGLPVH